MTRKFNLLVRVRAAVFAFWNPEYLDEIGKMIPCAAGGTFENDPPDAIVDALSRYIASIKEITLDAGRYRWLRANAIDCYETEGLEIVRLIPAHKSPNYGDIDYAIDAAMSSEQS